MKGKQHKKVILRLVVVHLSQTKLIGVSHLGWCRNYREHPTIWVFDKEIASYQDFRSSVCVCVCGARYTQGIIHKSQRKENGRDGEVEDREELSSEKWVSRV